MRTLRVRLTNVGTRLRVLLCVLILLVGATRGAGNQCPDAKSYFPLLPGSYWKYEQEMDNEVTPDEGEKRTVMALTKTDSGYIAEVQVRSEVGGRVFNLIYFCDTLGKIHTRSSKAKRFDLLGKLQPVRGDTLLVDKEKQFYSKCCEACDSTCLMLQNYDMDGGQEPAPNQVWRGKWFVRGIGIVTEGTSESGYNLIEYRIGNGPVVKKRWVMEQPPAK